MLSSLTVQVDCDGKILKVVTVVFIYTGCYRWENGQSLLHNKLKLW